MVITELECNVNNYQPDLANPPHQVEIDRWVQAFYSKGNVERYISNPDLLLCHARILAEQCYRELLYLRKQNEIKN